jgi:hypothetical protein
MILLKPNSNLNSKQHMKGKNYLILFCLLFSGVMKSYGQSITTAVFDATEDAHTKSGATNTAVNYGSVNELIISSTTYSLSPLSYYSTRSFVKFDLSAIPSNAIITSAKLRLRVKSESLVATNSTELYADLANTTWSQSTITHNSAISNNTIVSTVTTSNFVTVTDFFGSIDYREFDVKSQVQALAEGRIPNHGWRIRRNPDTGNLTPAIYYSTEHLPGNAFFYPKLEVKYYIPMTVTSATIVQATTTSSADGSISPVIAGGSSASKTYQWYNSLGNTIPGGTSLNLTGRTYGWYGLKVSGTDPSDVMYYAFLIGVKCSTVSVTFAPDGNYVDDTYMINNVSGSGTTAVFNTQTNNGNAGVIPASENLSPMTTEGLLRFRLWFDPNLTVNSANLTLYGNAHAPTDRPNTSYLKLVNGPWAETSVAYTNRPASLTTPSVTINSIVAGNGNATVNIASLVNSWKLNNPQNYGCHFQLTFYEGSVTKMQFNSSEAAAGSRPSLALSLTSTDCGTNTNLYYVPEENVGPEIADLRNSNKILRIRYKDYFDTDGFLNYSIKCLTDDTTPLINLTTKNANTNWIEIDLTAAGLVLGNVYLLELTDASGKKEYLKFKVVNS